MNIDKVLGEIKERIEIENFDDTEILIVTNNKLPNYITFKNVVILMTCVTKDDDKLPQISLEEILYSK